MVGRPSTPGRILATLILIGVFALTANLQAQSPLWGDLAAGPHKVGFGTIEKYDHSRTFRPKYSYTGTPLSGERARPVQVCYWYPAEIAEGDMPMVLGGYVFPNPDDPDFFGFVSRMQARELQNLMALLGRGQGDLLDVLNIEMMAYRDAAPAAGPFPVLIYFPGLGQGFSDNLVMCEYLASCGFVVVSTHSVGFTELNPDEDQRSLETIVRDMECALEAAGELEFADAGKVGAFGFALGGLAAQVLAMRNYDIEAVASLQGWQIQGERLAFASAGPFFDIRKMSVPSLFIYNGPEDFFDLSLVDSCRYADRFAVKFATSPQQGFSSLGAIREVGVDTTAIFAPASRPTYDLSCQYIRDFFDSFLNGSEAARAAIDDPSAAYGAASDVLTMAFKPGTPAPPTSEQFVAMIQAGEIEQAAEVFDRLKVTDPGSITFAEGTMNALGYGYLQSGRAEAALAIFRMNAETYPNSANCWDSWSDAYQAVGDTAGAIRCYQRVLEVLPADSTADNNLREILRVNATQGLERLQAQQTEN
jgi:dienelactone hydrolase